MSDTHEDMRTVGFGRNTTLFKRHRLQCGSFELGFSCRVGERLKATLVFFPLLQIQVSCFSSQCAPDTHTSSYQSKQGQHFFCVSLV